MFGLRRVSPLLAFFFSLSMSFTTASAVDLSPNTHQAVPGDFNGDGRLDALMQPLVTSGQSGILLQDGTGNLTVLAQGWDPGYLGLDWSAANSLITTADLNGDGRDDVVIQPRTAGQNASVLITDPTVQLLNVAQIIPANYLGLDWSAAGHLIVPGDFDGDRQKELLLQGMNPGDPSAIVHADPAGHLVALTQSISDGYLGRRWNATDVAVYVGDFNGDGRQDLLLQVKLGDETPAEARYALLLADTSGHFTQVAETWGDTAFGADWSPATHRLSIQTINGVTGVVLTATDGSSNYLFQADSQGLFEKPAVQWQGTKSAAQALKDQTAASNSSISVVAQPAPKTATPSSTATTATPVQTATLHMNAGIAPVTASAIGELSGTGGVNGGTATYSIPITVPPGIAGMQPSVALSYSSRGGNGEVGMGWSLSAGSAIHRCPATLAQDGYAQGVTYTSGDRLCLDGQHLIAISGAYGQSGTVYHTELDSYVRITQTGNLTDTSGQFEVDHPDGRIGYYGSGSNGPSNLPSAISMFIAAGAPAPLEWVIGREQDRYNNVAVYNYAAFGSGEYHLWSIVYTGSISGGTITAGSRAVNFSYATRSDPSTSYLAGGETVQNEILTGVTTSVNGGAVRNYYLNYSASAATNRSLLQSVQECAPDNSSAANCLPATTFAWQNSAPAFTPISPAAGLSDSGVIPTVTVTPDHLGTGLRQLQYANFNGANSDFSLVSLSPNFSVVGSPAYYGTLFSSVGTGDQSNIAVYVGKGVNQDFNNDGAADILYQSVTKAGNGGFPIEIATSTHQQQFGFGVPSDTGITAVEPDANLVSSGDYTGNGWNDIIVSRIVMDSNNKSTGTTEVQVFMNPGTAGSAFAPQPNGPLISLNDGCSDISGNKFAPVVTPTSDMDGNGVPDLMVSTLCAVGAAASAVTPSGVIFLSHTIDGSNKVVGTWKTFAQMGVTYFQNYANCSTCTYKLIDINGDGLPDFVFKTNDGTGNWFYQLNQGNGTFGPVVNTNVNIGSDQPAVLLTGDMRGDGKDEILYPGPWRTDAGAVWCIEKKINGGTDTTQVCGYAISTEFPGFDETIYHYYVLSFDENAQGVYIPTSHDYNLYAAPTSQVGDLNGDGMSDVFYGLDSTLWTGSWQNNCNPGLCSNSDGLQVEKNTGQAPDLMTGVTTGFQIQSTWQYQPLAQLNGNTSAPYYSVSYPCTTTANTSDYYCFASSMYVVSDYKTSDGVGGTREFTYGYQDAVYNNKGRGFQGFRVVQTNDLQANLTTVVSYLQDFPFSGQPIESKVTVTAAITGVPAGALVSDTTYTYPCSGTTTVCTSHPVVTPYVTYWAYPLSSTENRYDPYNGSALVSTTTANYTYDSNSLLYGHVASTTAVTTDSAGDSNTAINTPVYAPNTTSWCINELSSQTLESKVGYGSLPGTYTLVPGASDITRVTNYAGYNSACKVTETMQDQGTTYEKDTSYGYDGFGNTSSVTVSSPVAQPPSGSYGTLLTSQDYGVPSRASSTTYNPDGYFPSQTQNPLNQVTNYNSWDAASGQPTQVTDPNGVVSTYQYDGFGRKIQETDGPLPTINISYTAANASVILGQTPPNAFYAVNTTQSGYPGNTAYYDQFSRSVGAGKNGFATDTPTVETEYDNLGRVTAVSEPFNVGGTPVWNTTTYDVLNRPHLKTDAEGVQTGYAYSSLTTTITTTPGDGSYGTASNRVDKEIRNGVGKLLSVENGNGGGTGIDGTTQFRYDAQGNPVVIVDATGNQIQATYNLLGQKTAVSDPDQGNSTYAYDVLGEVLQQTDAKNQQISTHYDLLGRMTSRVQPEGTSTWCYDSPTCVGPGTTPLIGKLYNVTQYDGYSETYSYDTFSRPTNQHTVIGATGYDTTTTYDSSGRVGSVSYPGSYPDTAPVSTSGSNQTVLLNSSGSVTVTLNGTGSAATNTTYPTLLTWTQLTCPTTMAPAVTDGPAVALSNPNALSPTFTATTAGNYCFTLTVSDGFIATTSPVVMVTVLPGTSGTPAASSESGTGISLTGQVNLNWTGAGGANYYKVYESVDGGAFSLLPNQPTSPTDPLTGKGSTTANHTYTYQVQGYATNGLYGPMSGTSNGVEVTFTPTAPTTTTAPAQSNWDGSVPVNWSGATGVVTEYDVQLGQSTLVDGHNQWQVFGTCSALSPNPTAVVPTAPATSCTVPGNSTTITASPPSYGVRVYPCNGSANCSATHGTSGLVSVAYQTPPAVPTGLNLSPNPSYYGYQNYTLNWTEATTGVGYYKVYESANGGAYTNPPNPSGTSYSPPSSKPVGSYSYYVKACFSNGNCSSGSAAVTETVAQLVTPGAPNLSSDYTVIAAGGTVTLSWNQPSGTLSYYNVSKYSTNTATTTTRNVGNVTSYAWTLSQADYVDFNVQACNSVNCGGWSNTIQVQVGGSGGGGCKTCAPVKPGSPTPAPTSGTSSSGSSATTPSSSGMTTPAPTSGPTASVVAPLPALDSLLSTAPAQVMVAVVAPPAPADHAARSLRSSTGAPIFAPPLYKAWADARVMPASGTQTLARLQVQYNYTGTGYLQSLSNAIYPSQKFWTANTLDVFGQVTQETYGNGVVSNITTNQDPMGRMSQIMTTSGSATIQNNTYSWWRVGNLASRSWVAGSQHPQETFGYDVLNRLNGASVTGTSVAQPAVSYAYDTLGDITCKSDVTGQACTPNSSGYTYGQSGEYPHGVTSITGTVNGISNPSFAYDADGNMTNRAGTNVQWNSLNLPTCIDQAGGTCASGSNYSQFTYAPDKHRYKQVAMVNGVQETTLYVGNAEIVTSGSVSQYRQRISAYGKDVLTLDWSSDGSAPKCNYEHQDHLGSVDAITDCTGAPMGSYGYGPFGQRRDPASGGTPSAATVSTDRGSVGAGGIHRGFTNHEMLDNVALIHMNGRVYDPILGRFLSVDPVFQFAHNGQSLNPYSYVMNNPLSLTDPTGYCVAGDLCFNGGEHNRDAKGNLLSKDAQQIVAMKNGTTKTIGSFLVSKDSAGNVAVTNGAQNSQNSNDGQNKPTAVAGIGSPGQASKTPPSSIDVTATDVQGGSVRVQNVGDKISLPISDRNKDGGYGTPTEAALAQFHAYKPEYDALQGKGELTGLVYGNGSRDFFSIMIRVPTQFTGTFLTPAGYDVVGLSHTHPDGSTFGGLDWYSPAVKKLPSFMMNSDYNVYKWIPGGDGESTGAYEYGRSLGWMPGMKNHHVGPPNTPFNWGITPVGNANSGDNP